MTNNPTSLKLFPDTIPVYGEIAYRRRARKEAEASFMEDDRLFEHAEFDLDRKRRQIAFRAELLHIYSLIFIAGAAFSAAKGIEYIISQM